MVAFDQLYLKGGDLRRLPLETRKTATGRLTTGDPKQRSGVEWGTHPGACRTFGVVGSYSGGTRCLRSCSSRLSWRALISERSIALSITTRRTSRVAPSS